MARKYLSGVETNTIKITGGTPGSGKVLTSDGSGNGAWSTPSTPMPRVSSTASGSSLTPDASAYDMYAYTALAANLTINAPTGSPADGQKMMFRFKDNSGTRTLTWNAIFRVIGVTLPSVTVASKTIYVGCVYNSADTKWDVVSVNVEV